jgi:hypothetical protein
VFTCTETGTFFAKFSKESFVFALSYNGLPNEETLSLQIVIVTYLYRFGHMCTRYRFVSLSLQGKSGSIIAFGTSEQLSLLLVTSLGILESLSLLEVKSDNI